MAEGNGAFWKRWQSIWHGAIGFVGNTMEGLVELRGKGERLFDVLSP